MLYSWQNCTVFIDQTWNIFLLFSVTASLQVNRQSHAWICAHISASDRDPSSARVFIGVSHAAQPAATGAATTGSAATGATSIGATTTGSAGCTKDSESTDCSSKSSGISSKSSKSS